MEDNDRIEVVGDKEMIEAKSAALCDTGKPSAEIIAGWKSRYGDVYELPSDDEETPLTVYCRRPSRQHLTRYMKTVSLKSDIVTAGQNLLKDTMLYPDMEKLNPLFTEKPGLLMTLSSALQDTVGLNVHFLARKL
jgi:hypothetical protein